MEAAWLHADYLESAGLRALVSELHDCLRMTAHFSYLVVMAFGLPRCLRLLHCCSSRPELVLAAEAARRAKPTSAGDEDEDEDEGTGRSRAVTTKA